MTCIEVHRNCTAGGTTITEKGCNERIIQTGRGERCITWSGVTGSRGMISRDGGWVSVMPLDGRAMCFMYHVRWVKGRGDEHERRREFEKGTETENGVSAQCDGEHSIRKQMSFPKHASCPAYLSARGNAMSSVKREG